MYHAYLYCFVPMKEANNVSPASANKYLRETKAKKLSETIAVKIHYKTTK